MATSTIILIVVVAVAAVLLIAALAWLATQPAITTVIPGARNAEQARANAAAGEMSVPLSYDQTVHEVYDELVREHVHGRW